MRHQENMHEDCQHYRPNPVEKEIDLVLLYMFKGGFNFEHHL